MTPRYTSRAPCGANKTSPDASTEFCFCVTTKELNSKYDLHRQPTTPLTCFKHYPALYQIRSSPKWGSGTKGVTTSVRRRAREYHISCLHRRPLIENSPQAKAVGSCSAVNTAPTTTHLIISRYAKSPGNRFQQLYNEACMAQARCTHHQGPNVTQQCRQNAACIPCFRKRGWVQPPVLNEPTCNTTYCRCSLPPVETWSIVTPQNKLSGTDHVLNTMRKSSRSSSLRRRSWVRTIQRTCLLDESTEAPIKTRATPLICRYHSTVGSINCGKRNCRVQLCFKPPYLIQQNINTTPTRYISSLYSWGFPAVLGCA